jgi:hypothetical protein
MLRTFRRSAFKWGVKEALRINDRWRFADTYYIFTVEINST